MHGLIQIPDKYVILHALDLLMSMTLLVKDAKCL